MITLYTFGPAFGLPDPSPFVTKAEVLLKMAGLAYQTDPTGFRRAPKGKLPYIDDDGERIADSTLIRWHLEKNTALISKGDCRSSSVPSGGRSKRWRRTICIGRSSMPAGQTMPISLKAHRNFSEKSLPSCAPLWSPSSGDRSGARFMARAWGGISRRRSLLSERGQSPRLQNFSAPSRFLWATNRPVLMQPFLPSLPVHCVRTSIP